MKNLTLAFMVAMAFVSFGCKKKGAGGAGEAMAKMTEFKDEMCKCKDAKCAQDVSDKMTKWSQEQSKNQKEPPKMSEEDTKKAAAIGEEMGKCMQAAMGAGMGSADPAAGSADPAAGSADPAAGSAAGSADPAAGSAAPAGSGSAAAEPKKEEKK
ncbi:MAG TPA: hypothetical protein VIV11_31805 [Kofleriaceae bacterium]